MTGYLLGHSRLPPDPFVEHVIAAALQIRDTQAAASRSFADPLTQTQLGILRLLPTTTTDQAAAAPYISRNTVKTHLKSIYQKLSVASRSEAPSGPLTCGSWETSLKPQLRPAGRSRRSGVRKTGRRPAASACSGGRILICIPVAVARRAPDRPFRAERDVMRAETCCCGPGNLPGPAAGCGGFSRRTHGE